MHCSVLFVKVQKGTTEIRKTSSLIRHKYILVYIVIRTNRYIVIHASRGIVYYCGATEFLSEHVYNTPFIQRLYNTPIKHANQKLSGKEKLSFIEVIKRRHIYP